MRITSFLFSCILIAILSSCSDQNGFFAEEGNRNQVLFYVDDFTDATQTRTNCDPTNNYKITWAEGDAIGIFPYEGDQEPFVIPASQIGQSKASFDGGYWALKDGKSYNAYYPFNRDNYASSETKTKIPVSYLGQYQNGKECNVGAFDYTYSDWATSDGGNSVNFAFHHVGAFLVINLPIPATTTYASLTVSCGSKIIPTSGTYDLTANSPVFVEDSKTKASSLTLTLNNCKLEGESNATFYMMMPPVDLSSYPLEVILKSSDGTSCTYTLPSTKFVKSKLYKLTGKPTVCNVDGTTYQWLIDHGFVDSNNVYNVTTTSSLRLDDVIPPYLKSEIKSLKVSGPLNPSDIATLRSLSVLEILDMSDANIITGSGNYYSGGTEKYWGGKIEAQTTKKDVFPAYFIKDSQLKNLHTLYLPNSVTEIPYYALWEAKSIKHIKLGTGLKKIYGLSFDCDINSITIPKGVEFVCTATFEKCHELTSIKVEEGNKYYSSTDGVLYDDDHKQLRAWPANKEFNGFPKDKYIWSFDTRSFADSKCTEIVIPEGVAHLGSAVFARCKNLRSITFPSNELSLSSDIFVETGGSIKEIHMKATTPPKRCYFNPNDVELKNATIYVPKGSFYKYESYDSEWKKFPIKEED